MLITSKLIFFDDAKKYVMRSFVPPRYFKKPFPKVDYLGRTKEDRKFLEQFEKIFIAAYKGHLQSCKEVVKEGYCDFDAYSIRKFSEDGATFLNVSPRTVAKIKNNQQIVKFFESVGKPKQSLSLISGPISKPKFDTQDEKTMILWNIGHAFSDEEMTNIINQLNWKDKTWLSFGTFANFTDDLWHSVLAKRNFIPKQTVQVMIKKFPVSVKVLKMAVEDKHSTDIVRILHNKAVKTNKETAEWISWFFKNLYHFNEVYPDDLILDFIDKADKVTVEDISQAKLNNLSKKILLKMKEKCRD